MNTVGELKAALARFPNTARIGVLVEVEDAAKADGEEPTEFALETITPMGCNEWDVRLTLGRVL